MKHERTIRKVMRWGSSFMITIPMPFAKEHAIVEGDYVEVICEGETLHVRLLEKSKPKESPEG